jgi:hypothetical protein
VKTVGRPRRPIAVPRADRFSEDDAEAILAELHLEPWALDAINRHITSLRGNITDGRESPRPSAAKKTIAKIANQAEALASTIDKIDPNWLFTLRLQFSERSERGIVIVSPGSDVRAEAKMKQWIAQLRALARDFKPFARVPHDFLLGPKAKCAWAAARLIRELSPATPLKKGTDSKLHTVASLLWRGVTGEEEASMRRACDRVADLFAAMTRFQREHDDAKHRQ